MHQGQISGMQIFEDFINRFAQGPPGDKEFDDIILSLVVSLMSIGTLIGALSGAYTADWWGRRKSLTFGVCVFIIGNVIQITAMSSWVHMMMGRFVAGLGVGNLSVGVPMYQSECTSKYVPVGSFGFGNGFRCHLVASSKHDFQSRSPWHRQTLLSVSHSTQGCLQT